jgi:subtilisin family serine protease
MAIVEALIEVDVKVPNALDAFSAAGESIIEGQSQVRSVLPEVKGIHYRPAAKPVPMFTHPEGLQPDTLDALSQLPKSPQNRDMASVSQVVPVQIEEQAIAALNELPGVRVWPSSPIYFFGPDCPPFEPAVDVSAIQIALGVPAIWAEGHRGEGVIVALLDKGIDGSTYPVVGGYSRAGGQQPGTAPISSHGSMAAADVLVAAPDAKLYDYPFLVPRSGGALVMMNEVLNQRGRDGTPHIVSNSWGFYGFPPHQDQPLHEVWDLQHPLHRKIREVVASGATVMFAAGNCGSPCPAGDCRPESIGPGYSIHGSNSLTEVITVAAVNCAGERIGYSSQGRGMFEQVKPDVACYSHFFGNFGPGRPAGTLDAPFDNGTSAACPIAAGVAALLLSAKPGLTAQALRNAIVGGAGGGLWNADVGYGIVNAQRSFSII